MTKWNALMAVVCALVLSACGAIDTMKNVEEYSKNMDQKMDHTNEGIDKTNAGMDKTIEGINRTNNGMDKTIEGINKTNAGIDKTTAAVHKQVLTIAMQEMLAPENTEFLNPPISILPFAKVFAEEATAQELLEVVHAAYMDTQVGYDANAAQPTAEQLRVHKRNVKWAMIGALSAFASEEQFAEIQKEVETPGRYKQSARVFAVARYNMTRDAFLNPLKADANAANLGGLKFAVKYYNAMKKVSQLNYFRPKTEATPSSEDAFQVKIPRIDPQVVESTPDPNKPNEKTTVTNYVTRYISVQHYDAKYEDSKDAEIRNIAKVLYGKFKNVEGDDAKKLLEQLN